MKNIEWQKITWYSQWVAIGVCFIFVPIVAFKIGVAYSKTKEVLENRQQELITGMTSDIYTIRGGETAKDASTTDSQNEIRDSAHEPKK